MSIAVESDSSSSRGWSGPHPSGRVAGAHKVVGVLYLILALMFTLGLVFGRRGALDVGMAVGTVAIFAFGMSHLLLSRAAMRTRTWARGPSILVALPLLFAFPIGTFFAVVIIINSAKSWD